MKTKKVIWLSAIKHIVPADYEIWLEEMALQGWNIKKIGQWSSIRLSFIRTDPKKYRFVYDIQPNPKRDYQKTYEQFGWELVGVMSSCFIWRKEYSQERPEAFSDMQSIEDRNKRVIKAVSVSFFLFFPAFFIALIMLIANFKSLYVGDIIQYLLFLLLSGGIGLSLARVTRTIYRNRYR